MIQRCELCAFWSDPFDDRNGAGRYGQCRRRAPRIVELDNRPLTRWPITRDLQGCGEHRARKAAA